MWFIQWICEKMSSSLASPKEKQIQEWEELIKNIPDPFAKEIAWIPMLLWGSTFKTYNLAQDHVNEKLELQTSKEVMLVHKKYIWIGCFLEIIAISSLLFSSFLKTVITTFLIWNLWFSPTIVAQLIENSWNFFWYFSIIGLFFIWIWLLGFLHFMQPITFDKKSGYFYKGKPEMIWGIIDPSDKKLIPHSSIYAIQVLLEHVRGENTNFLSYEINLILNDKNRINIMDHGERDDIKSNAKIIGEYLWVPVWGI